VPILLSPQTIRRVQASPTVLRLAPDRTVLDLPWGQRACAVANVWHDARWPGGWARVHWPVDPLVGRFIAPVDLQLGHVLEITAADDGSQLYAWVADVDGRRFVLAPASDAAEAARAAGHSVDIFRTAELAAVEDAWRARIDRVRRTRDEVG
jgi:hypothetical protein